MTILQSNSPTNLEFNPRHPSFDLIDSLKKDWHGDSAFRTAWYNALSMLFPIGEKFFIDSVLHFKKEITDPKLLNEIKNLKKELKYLENLLKNKKSTQNQADKLFKK